MTNEIFVDNFAGGGGASTGIEFLQVARCGNAVPPQCPEALVRANLPEYCPERIRKVGY